MQASSWSDFVEHLLMPLSSLHEAAEPRQSIFKREEKALYFLAFSATIRSFLLDGVMKALENCPAFACAPIPAYNTRVRLSVHFMDQSQNGQHSCRSTPRIMLELCTTQDNKKINLAADPLPGSCWKDAWHCRTRPRLHPRAGISPPLC